MPSKLKTPIPYRLESALTSWGQWHRDIRVTPVVVKQLTGGQTNTSWLLESGGCRWVARLNNPRSGLLGIDRARERAVHNLVAHINIAPAYLYLHAPSDTSIFEYVEGECLSANDLTSPQYLNALYEIIERYQHIALDAPRFNYREHLLNYWQKVEGGNPAFADQYRSEWCVFFERLAAFCERNWKPVITHHDLEPGNILMTDSGIKIIDWEYSGNGYPMFDRCYLNADKSAEPAILQEIIRWLAQLWTVLQKIG